MERIEAIWRGQPEPARIERIPRPERASRDRRRQQGGREEPPAQQSDEEDSDDGREHVDVTA
jgi:hypothetical protein